MTEYRTPGKTTLTPDVLLTIARMAALEVEGVSRMIPVKGGVKSLFGRASDGVLIEIEDGIVLLDLHLALEDGVNMRETSRTVQQRVARAISEMTGMEVGRVNVHIEDINFPSEV
ncbi:MAG: hypothetical protein FD146_1298 [Anaerolineaceae bacterium]|nr:MAG: hypothetical protein FD146_1298 [Anaerolineaceae bacterium]